MVFVVKMLLESASTQSPRIDQTNLLVFHPDRVRVLTRFIMTVAMAVVVTVTVTVAVTVAVTVVMAMSMVCTDD